MIIFLETQVRVVKARGLAAWKHACGNNWKLLDMFVEAGYDVYQAIQASYAFQVGAPAGGPPGGYIFGDTHSIAVGTKYDNFVAMLDAYHKLAPRAAQFGQAS